MNFGYIDTLKKQNFFRKKPKVYRFPSGHNLYIFSQFKKTPSVLKKKEIIMIDGKSKKNYEKIVYPKTILQILKEKNLSEISFCFENAMDYLFILEDMFKKNISFSLTDCNGSENASDYFLEAYGHPVRIIGKVKEGLFVYLGGHPPLCDEKVIKLDFTKNLYGEKIVVDEFIIKDTFFPIKITSLGILDAALDLTGKEIKDIIIKLCIIRCQQE